MLGMLLAVGAGAVYAQESPTPVQLDWDDNGRAYVDITDFVATGEVTVSEDGVITNTATGWKLTFYLDNEDFTNVTNIAFTTDESTENGYKGLVNDVQIFAPNGTTKAGNGWWASWRNIDYTGSYEGTPYRELVPTAGSIVINGNSEVGSMKISSICITKNIVKASEVVDLTQSDFKTWSAPVGGTPQPGTPNFENHVGDGASHAGGTTIYGDGGVGYLNYADLTGYDKLRIKATPGAALRVLLNRIEDNGATTEVNPTVGEDGWAIVDLSGYEYVHLNALKIGWNGIDVQVDVLGVTRDGVDYYIFGSGEILPSVREILNNESVTAIDATGLDNAEEALTLKSANPNCLFIVDDAAKLSNASNVLVLADGAYNCAKLQLTPGHPFRAPAAFTATEATLAKGVSEASAFGTLVLPYDAALPDGCKAHKLTAVTGNTVSGEALTTITANEPLLISGAGTYTFSAENVTIQPEAESMTSGLLTGVYTNGTYAPLNSYVLQKQTADDAATFHKVAEADKQPMTPFSAYLTVPAEVAQVNARLILDLGDGATAVDDVQAATEAVTVVEIYDLSGCRVDAPVKGINLMKMSDGTVKKVIVK